MIGHYLALRQPSKSDDYIGLICQHTSTYQVAQAAIEDAEFMCVREHGDAPDVEIKGKTDQTFPYIPAHLHYILLEVFISFQYYYLF